MDTSPGNTRNSNKTGVSSICIALYLLGVHAPAPTYQRLGFPHAFPVRAFGMAGEDGACQPVLNIRNPVNPVHPVSNIDWTGLREEQDYSPLPASSVPR